MFSLLMSHFSTSWVLQQSLTYFLLIKTHWLPDCRFSYHARLRLSCSCQATNPSPFFLPRKAKTVLLLPSDQSIEDFRTINITLTESQLINEFNSLLEAHHNKDKESTALSSREAEVLRLIASGKTNKEIAQELNISINTVLTHRKNMTAKLGIKSVSGLSFYAMMNGII